MITNSFLLSPSAICRPVNLRVVRFEQVDVGHDTQPSQLHREVTIVSCHCSPLCAQLTNALARRCDLLAAR